MKGLRGFRDTVENEHCGREEQFAELLPFLGDKAAQGEIRRQYPGARHCRLLALDPNACSKCILESNPYKNADLAAVVEAKRNTGLIAEALDLYQQYDLGLLSREDLLMLPPEAIVALSVVRQFEAAKQRRELSLNLAALFAGGG